MHGRIFASSIFLSILAVSAHAQPGGVPLADSLGQQSILDEELHWLFDEKYIGNMGWADVDLDGDVDVAILHFESKKAYLTVYRNEGGMDFTAREVFELPDGEVREILFEDIDGDDYPDLLLARFRGPNSIHRNDGRGGFESRGTMLGLQADDSFDLIGSDIDNDGDKDLVVSNGGKTKRYLNDGQGLFSAGRAINREASRGTAVVAGDIDADGDSDLILATAYGYLFVHGNLGDGTFDAEGISLTKSRLGTMGYLVLADADGDTDLDLFAAGRQDCEYFPNQGDGTFGPAVSLDGSTYLLVGDMDLDGDIDLVTSPLRLMLNNGSGQWSRADSNFDDGDARVVTLQDIDNDDDLDFVAMPNQGTGLWIYRNNTNAPEQVSN